MINRKLEQELKQELSVEINGADKVSLSEQIRVFALSNLRSWISEVSGEGHGPKWEVSAFLSDHRAYVVPNTASYLLIYDVNLKCMT